MLLGGSSPTSSTVSRRLPNATWHTGGAMLHLLVCKECVAARARTEQEWLTVTGLQNSFQQLFWICEDLWAVTVIFQYTDLASQGFSLPCGWWSMDMGTQTGAGVSMETSKHTRTQCQALVEQQVPDVSRGALSPRSVAARCCYTALQLFEVQKADSGLVLMPWMIQSRGFKVSKSMGINVVHFTSQANWKHFKKRTWWKSDSAAKCWGGWANTGQTSRTQNCLFGKEKLEQPLGASTAHPGQGSARQHPASLRTKAVAEREQSRL